MFMMFESLLVRYIMISVIYFKSFNAQFCRIHSSDCPKTSEINWLQRKETNWRFSLGSQILMFSLWSYMRSFSSRPTAPLKKASRHTGSKNSSYFFTFLYNWPSIPAVWTAAFLTHHLWGWVLMRQTGHKRQSEPGHFSQMSVNIIWDSVMWASYYYKILSNLHRVIRTYQTNK